MLLLMVVVWGVFVEGWLSHILLFDAELWPCVCLWFSQLLTEALYTLGGISAVFCVCRSELCHSKLGPEGKYFTQLFSRDNFFFTCV